MRAEKQLLLDEMKGLIDHYKSFLIMQYEKLDANTTSDFRKDVASTGGEVEVMRKRILVKAASAAGVELDLPTLQGHIGLVFAGPDALQTTKTVFKFSKDTNEAVKVLGGRIDGEQFSAEQMSALSKLPGKDEMRAQIVGLLEAPMSQTVSVMDAQLTSVLHCIENKCKKES